MRSWFKIIFVFITFSFVRGQVSKGDEYFKKMDYHKAIRYYLHALKKTKHSGDPIFLAHLGDCYRFIKDYSNAATYYRLAIQKGSTDPDVYLHDGMILKSTGNFEEAEIQYNRCLELRPGDYLAQVGILSCHEIKKWRSKPQEYEINNLVNLNTNLSEFSPVLWNGKLVFTAERQNDLIDFTEYEYNGHPYLDVYSINTDGKTVSGKPSGLSRKLNSTMHEGPVCFSKDGKTIYFTRVSYVALKGKKDFTNRAKIYSADISGKKIKNIKELKFDSDEYSIAHPTLSDDGLTLFFSSDKPGGYGGFDIYFSKFTNGEWAEPINLGPDINTVGNEEFPSIRYDGILFFSSEGLPGFGGMDIFSAHEISDKWILRRNEGIGLNDITDDFGVYFTGEKEGFFTSDRAGGKGSDDIYHFIFNDKSEVLEGYILNTLDTSNVAYDQKIYLIDSLGNIYAQSRTNKKGYFKFNNLDPDKSYLIRMDDQDSTFSEYPRYYFADKNGNILTMTEKLRQGKFVFNALKCRQNSMSAIDAEDDIILAGNMFFPDSNNLPMSNKKLVVKDEKNHIIDEVNTNNAGSFAFRKLPSGHNYIIEIVEEDTLLLPPGTKILVANKQGKEIKTIVTSGKTKFQLKLLQQEKDVMSAIAAEDKDVVMDLSGIALNPEKVAIPGTKVFLLDEQGNKIAEVITDKDGQFVFKNLPSNKKYILSLDTDDPNLSEYEKVFIADKNGKVVKELNRLKQFQYNILAYEKVVLAEMYVDDSWSNIEINNKKNTKVDTSKNLSFEKEKTPVNNTSNIKNTNKNDSSKVVVVKKDIIKRDSLKKIIVKKDPVKKDTLNRVVIAKKTKDCSERLYVPPVKSNLDTVIFTDKLFFSYATWYLEQKNTVILDKIYSLMQSDSKLELLISSHSDSRGGDFENNRISELRAQTIQKYLLKKGINKDRIQTKSFGEMQLISPCCDGSPCNEEMHALNRRAELEIFKKKN
ncbi:MAG: OmpA family protein [Bacteroidota bacterium]